MTFVADESVGKEIVDRVRRDGHAVVYIAEVDPGITDLVLELSRTAAKASLVVGALRDHGDQLRSSFSVLSHGSLRIRRPGV